MRRDMYRARRSRNYVQSGGDFISSISPSSLMNPSLSVSTVQYLMSVANLTSPDSITNLTPTQLSSLIVGINNQINTDNSMIAINNLSIAMLQGMSTGLYSTYNGLMSKYNHDLSTFYGQSSAYVVNSTIISNDNSTLISLYALSTSYASSLIGFENNYSTIFSTLAGESSTIINYESTYQATLLAISSVDILYSTSLQNLSSVSSQMSADWAGLNNLSNSPTLLSTFSSNYQIDLGAYSALSTNVVNYNYSSILYNSQLNTTYSLLSSMLDLTSFQLLTQYSYLSTIQYYSSLELLSQSSINSYNSQISSLYGQISSLTLQDSALYSTLQGDISIITGQSSQFYGYLNNAIGAEISELTYGTQAYNSLIGYVVASLGVNININQTLIDGYIFDLIPNSGASATQISTAQGLQPVLSRNNRAMNSIINQLNTMDITFSNLLQTITNESTLKAQFLTQRHAICNTYEIPALAYDQPTTDALEPSYTAAFQTLNNTVVQINAQINQRITTINAINSTVVPLINLIDYFLNPNSPGTTQIPSTITQFLDSNGSPLGGMVPFPTSNSNFAFVPPITFTTPASLTPTTVNVSTLAVYPVGATINPQDNNTADAALGF
jgi:hypothetical protein